MKRLVWGALLGRRCAGAGLERELKWGQSWRLDRMGQEEEDHRATVLPLDSGAWPAATRVMVPQGN